MPYVGEGKERGGMGCEMRDRKDITVSSNGSVSPLFLWQQDEGLLRGGARAAVMRRHK